MAQHVKGEIDARGDLEGAEAVGGRGGQPPGEKEPSANLEKEKRYHQRLQDVGAVDVAEYFHHRVVRLCTGTRRTATLAGASLSDRSSSASAIAQHATHSHVSGTGSCSM